MLRDLRRRLLVWLLRLAGISLLLAWPNVFLPTGWMASTHAFLGLGAFPASPLVEYLTRSIAALYGVHGGVFLIASTDLARYRPLILYLGVMNVAFGGLVLGIDLHAGMPAWWTWVEGPSILAMGLAVLGLTAGLGDADS